MNDLDPNSPNSPDSQRRLLVALALAMVLTFAYTYFVRPPAGSEVTGGQDGGVAAVTDAGTPALAAADRKSTRLNSSHSGESRMPSSA